MLPKNSEMLGEVVELPGDHLQCSSQLVRIWDYDDLIWSHLVSFWSQFVVPMDDRPASYKSTVCVEFPVWLLSKSSGFHRVTLLAVPLKQPCKLQVPTLQIGFELA